MSRLKKYLTKTKKYLKLRIELVLKSKFKRRIIISVYKSLKLVFASSPSFVTIFRLALKIKRRKYTVNVRNLSTTICKIMTFLLVIDFSICIVEAFIVEVFYNYDKPSKKKFTQRVFKNTINILALPLTGTFYIFDKTLNFLETELFNQPLPIYPHGPFIFY